MTPRHRALAVLVTIIWGVNFVVIDEGLRDVPPLVLTALRFLACAPLVLLVPRPTAKLRFVLGYGVMLGVVKFGLLFTAMAHGMPAGLASLVLQLQALFSLALASLLLGERPDEGPGRRGRRRYRGHGPAGDRRHWARRDSRADHDRRGGCRLGARERDHPGQWRDPSAVDARVVEPGATVAAARAVRGRGRAARRRARDQPPDAARTAGHRLRRLCLHARRIRGVESAHRPLLGQPGRAVQPARADLRAHRGLDRPGRAADLARRRMRRARSGGPGARRP